MTIKYTVVENAGYEGERDITSFTPTGSRRNVDALMMAERFIKRWYRAGEIETLHVAIRKDTPDGGTYD